MFHLCKFVFIWPELIKTKPPYVSTSCQNLNLQLFQNIFVFAATSFQKVIWYYIRSNHIIWKNIRSHILKFEKIKLLFSSPKVIKSKLAPARTFQQFFIFQLFQNIFCSPDQKIDSIVSYSIKSHHLKKYPVTYPQIWKN